VVHSTGYAGTAVRDHTIVYRYWTAWESDPSSVIKLFIHIATRLFPSSASSTTDGCNLNRCSDSTRHLRARLHELERGKSTQRLGSQSQTYSAWEFPSHGCTELSTSAGSSLPGISSVSISAEFGTPTIPRARAHSIIALRSAEVNPRRS